MVSQMQFQYETIGNKNYLIATLADAGDLINYQLQMLVNNEVPNILPVTKRQMNEDIQLCYQVSSKLSLAQATSRSKITRDGFIKLIEGSISALNELGEYHLVNTGIIFDENYIFIKPGNFKPSFVYLPIYNEDAGIAPFKEFLLGLIVQSKVEITGDNFVQIMLETLNSPTLSLQELTKAIKNFSGVSASLHQQQPIKAPVIKSAPQAVQMETPVSIDIPEPPIDSPIIAPMAKPKFMDKLKKKSHQEKPQNDNNHKQNNKETKEPHPKRNLFLIIQIGMLAIIVSLVVSGSLNDPATGLMNYSYLLGCLIPAVGIDFVLYREWFKNDDKKATATKSKIKRSAVNNMKSGVAIPNKPEISVPKQTPPVAPKIPVAKEHQMQKPPIQTPVAMGQTATGADPRVTPSVAAAVTAEPDATYTVPVNKIESDDTFIMSDGVTMGAYLEYYDNGLLMKIKLDKPSIIVGRLSSQVDHLISNKKVGKIHAEFISENGIYFVKDYNSTNGTYINGSIQRIPGNSPVQISNGDRITLADFDLKLRC